MLCAIWYHLYNLKNVKNTYRGVLLLVRLQAEAQRLRKASHFYFKFIQISSYSNGDLINAIKLVPSVITICSVYLYFRVLPASASVQVYPRSTTGCEIQFYI